MKTPRLRILVGVCALTAGAGAAVPAQSSAASCSSAGLGYSYADGGATFGDRVDALKASGGASCKTARKIARTTALAVLFDGTVPKQPEGYELKLTKPCAGCTPRWTGVATRGKRKVTFAVLGGA